jgi:hypothetical protein
VSIIRTLEGSIEEKDTENVVQVDDERLKILGGMMTSSMRTKKITYFRTQAFGQGKVPQVRGLNNSFGNKRNTPDFETSQQCIAPLFVTQKITLYIFSDYSLM